MLSLEFLDRVHERLAPRTYLEIGVEEGNSLSLSRCPSVGIDPEFCVVQQLAAPCRLIRATSDEYFATLEETNSTPFGKRPLDFSYIDGDHHFEQALRDFIAIERHSASSSMIAFDDIFPRDVDGSRERHTFYWTGDVFRVLFALAEWRPDLLLVSVDTEPTGTLLVANLDPTSRILADNLDDIIGKYLEPDPQSVPVSVLRRQESYKPKKALALPLYDELIKARSKSKVSTKR